MDSVHKPRGLQPVIRAVVAFNAAAAAGPAEAVQLGDPFSNGSATPPALNNMTRDKNLHQKPPSSATPKSAVDGFCSNLWADSFISCLFRRLETDALHAKQVRLCELRVAADSKCLTVDQGLTAVLYMFTGTSKACNMGT